MPHANPAIINFNGGEYAPEVEGRIDIPKYATGCSRLVNFIPTPQGPIRRRPGTHFVVDAVEQFVITPLATTPWLMEFRFNSQSAYVLLWGHYTLRFFTNHGYVETPTNQPPWPSALAATITDGTAVWTALGKPVWQASHAFSAHDAIIDTNGNLQLCTSGGTTAAMPPVFSTTKGVTTADGTAVWTCYAYEQWAASTAYAHYALIWAHGQIWQCSTAGTTDIAAAAGYVADQYSIPTPFAYSDLYDSMNLPALAWEASFDVVYLCHYAKTKPPLKLVRNGTTDWRLQRVNIDSGPFQSVNADNTLAVYASAETGAGITITANASIWTTDQIGELFYIRQDSIRNIGQWQADEGLAGTGAAAPKRGDRQRYNGVTYECMNTPTTGGANPPVHLSGQAWDGPKPGSHTLWAYRDAGYGFVRIRAVNGLQGGAKATNAITGITNANPAVVTCVAHGFTNGTLVFLTGVGGMTELNGNWYKVSAAAANTFALQNAAAANVDSTAFATWTSGGVVDSRYYTATADVISSVSFDNRMPYSCVGSDNATSQWAHGAWSDNQGYPNLVRFFRNRLCFYRDGYLWTSVSNDFENFNATNAGGVVTDDMAITVAMNTLEPAGWLIEGDALAIGTAGKELVIGETNSGQALSPTNVTKREQLAYGSRRIRSVRVGQETFFVQYSGRKLRSMRFDFYSNSYVSADMSVLAPHLTVGGITQMVYQQEPDSTFWAIRGDGALLAFTRQEEQDVAGWGRTVLGSADNNVVVRSAASIPAPDGTHDEVWLLVARTIAATAPATSIYVEYMEAPFLGGMATADGFFVDCGLRYSGALIPAGTAISGLDHLSGEIVSVLADGAEQPQTRVSVTGAIALAVDATNVVVGLPQYCDAVKMQLEVPIGQGTAQGTFRRVDKVTWRFANTVGGQMGVDGQPLDTIDFRDAGDALDTPIAPFTGDKFQLNAPGGWGTDALRIRYYNESPFPVELVGIFPQVQVNP